MSWLHRLAASVEEAALAAWRRRKAAVLTVVAIGLSLSFPAAAILSLARAGDFLERLARAERVRVYLVSTSKENEALALKDELEGLPDVVNATWVSAAEAQRRFLEAYPQLTSAAAELSAEELQFGPSIELEVDASVEATLALVELIASRSSVDEVRHDTRWVAELRDLRESCRRAEWVVGVVAFFVAAFGIGNAVSLSALARRDELATMRLVGAPAFHVRAPFVLEGCVQGLAGGVVAALVLSALSRLLATLLEFSLPDVVGALSGTSLLWLVVFPGCAGALGALLSVELILRRHAGLET